MKTRIIRDNHYDEYEVLTNRLEELNWALGGECDDIDCDKYVYRKMLKKNYRPILEHNFSCMANLKRDRMAVMRLLSLSKFKKFRYKGCFVCKDKLDKLSDDSIVVGFTRPCYMKKEKCVEWRGEWVHKGCKNKVRIPSGWIEYRARC